MSRATNLREYTPIKEEDYVSPAAKLVAWAIFLIIFIENGTLGLIPKQVYMVYKTVRLSDLIMYSLIVYSLFHTDEYRKEYSSRLMIIVKAILIYLLVQYVIAVIRYHQEPLEYFFRLKFAWVSFMIFPFILLMKRNGVYYLIKIILPFAVLSNIFYVLSAITGYAFLPEISIEKVTLVGGFKLYRVFGGTFYGEIFFLGIVYLWITKKFRLYQLAFAILFITPHILALGRSAWIEFVFMVLMMILWNTLRKKNLKVVLKQVFIFSFLTAAVVLAFIRFIPDSESILEGLQARVTQGQEDYEYKEGTYGSRLQSAGVLVELWLKSDILFGIGMHPMWVIKPLTSEEVLYVAGFSDIRWASILAAYGAVGFSMAIVFQILFVVITVKVLRRSKDPDQYVLLNLLFLSGLLFDTLINYTYILFSVTPTGFSMLLGFYIAATVCKYENPEKLKPKTEDQVHRLAAKRSYHYNRLSN